MSGEIPRPFGTFGLVAALLMSGVGVTVPARAEDCLAAPNSPAPQGTHWYYRLDWATQRKCWYTRAAGQPVQQAAAPTRLARATPLSKPAPSGPTPATDGAPMSVSPGDSPPPSPHVKILSVKPTSAQEITATSDKLAQGSANEGDPAPSMIEPSAPQASTSSQTIAQAAGPAPVPPVTWPDAPPAVAAVQAQTPVAIPTDAPADAVSVDAERIARGGTGMPMIVFPSLALVLMVVGILSMKIAAARRRRTIMDHAEPDRERDGGTLLRMTHSGLPEVMRPTRMMNDQREHEWRDNYDQRGSVHERREYQSLISAVSDSFRAEDGAEQITHQISKRRDKLAQLHQDLDRLLQSPTVA
jgi:hypothetical protein